MDINQNPWYQNFQLDHYLLNFMPDSTHKTKEKEPLSPSFSPEIFLQELDIYFEKLLTSFAKEWNNLFKLPDINN